MDRTAAEAIHLLPPKTGSGQALITGGNAMNNSLYGVLNRCKTRMGRCVLSSCFVAFVFRSFVPEDKGAPMGEIRVALPSIFLIVDETAS